MTREVKCPICRRRATWENNPHRPFCSERCRLIDLGAWTQERYRIPAEETDSGLDDDNKGPVN
ncbi:MAG TPA: DNA gyrase inhibitor YacG [Candidatus Binatia bacterium]|nr:DNA gyrase inhibitor YacG [Candidatus Binatia bacterium]